MTRALKPYRHGHLLGRWTTVAVGNHFHRLSWRRGLVSKISNDGGEKAGTITITPTKSDNKKPPKNIMDLKSVNEAIEEITGVHEIAILKKAVTVASDRLQASTQRLQDLRQQLDERTAAYQELSAKYNEMMSRRHEWTEQDVKNFAQITADEGRARSAVDATREAVKQAEDDWQSAQTMYMDAVRQRYHEEQVWHDKWRVLGTYWTWSLIALNSIVFVAGQLLHYRRETRRMNEIQSMLKPLSIAAESENEERRNARAEAEAASLSTKDDSASNGETKEETEESSLDQHKIWNDTFQQWTRKTVQLCQNTGELLRVQWTSAITSCSEVTQRVVVQPTLRMANEHDFHWPSAVVGATVAGLAFLLLTFVRSPRQ